MSTTTPFPRKYPEHFPAPPEEVGHEPAATMAVLPPLPNEEHHHPESSIASSSAVHTSESFSDANADHSVATLSSPWQYDALQSHCSGCRAEFLPLTNRRHHCRLCGKIFCHVCTQSKALIPPSSIVLVPVGGKKVAPRSQVNASFSPDQDPDRMLTYVSSNDTNNEQHGGELLYGRGLEERFKLAREPLRVCQPCHLQLAPLQADLRASNSNCVRFNAIDPTDARRLFNSPVAFTLGHEIRKAAYTLNNLLPMPKRMGAVTSTTNSSMMMMSGDSGGYDPFDVSNIRPNELQQCRESCAGMSPNLGNLDGVRIPARLLEQAKGVAVLTVAKGGFGLAGFEFGTGLVVARLPGSDNRWSAPSAIGTAGISWGALLGAQVSDHVFLLMNDNAVEMLFSDKGSVTLGADIGIALGPVGRTAEAGFGASAPSSHGSHAAAAPIYTYSMSKGFYAGVSLDGKVIFTRPNVNEKFYGTQLSATDILQGAVPVPPAAQPLYEALTRCHFYATGNVVNQRRQQQQHLANQSAFGGGGGGGIGDMVTMPPTHPNMAMQTPFYQPQYQLQDPVMGEYGEVIRVQVPQQQPVQHVPATSIPMPPAAGDQHSYAGMSDMTSEPGF